MLFVDRRVAHSLEAGLDVSNQGPQPFPVPLLRGVVLDRRSETVDQPVKLGVFHVRTRDRM